MSAKALLARARDRLGLDKPPQTPPSARPSAPPAPPPPPAAPDLSDGSAQIAATPVSTPFSFPKLDLGPVYKMLGGARHLAVHYPTAVVFFAILVSLVVIAPPYVRHKKSRRVSRRSAMAAAVLFTGMFKLTLSYFILV